MMVIPGIGKSKNREILESGIPAIGNPGINSFSPERHGCVRNFIFLDNVT